MMPNGRGPSTQPCLHYYHNQGASAYQVSTKHRMFREKPLWEREIEK